jgi:CheY-like chemotaxis protein/signal transduction histidine kinase/methyl-accepting chemotaxis protein
MALLKSISIRAKIISWFLLIGFVPMLTGMIFIYTWQKNLIEKKTLDKLIAIRDLKVTQLDLWFHEREGDIANIRLELESAYKNELSNGKEDYVNQIFSNHKDSYDAYDVILVVDKESNIIHSSDPSLIGLSDPNLFCESCDEYNTIVFGDIHYNRILSETTMLVSTKMKISSISEDLYIVAFIDLQNSLYKLLLERVGLGNTGETLIVNSDVIALNELRWYSQAPLNLKINAEPAVQAAAGNTGITRTTDYRGEPILAAYTSIPQTNWGFVCKQDLDELNQPVDDLLRSYFILFAVITVITVFLAILVSSSFSTPIKEMDTVAKRIKDGDFSARASVKTKDELGSLAKQLNSMAVETQSRINLMSDLSEVSESIVHYMSLGEFSEGITKTLGNITESESGVFYSLEDDSYMPVYSYGVDVESLHSFDGRNPQGMLSEAFQSKKIVFSKEVSYESRMNFKMHYGFVLPSQYITIPIIFETKPVGFIVLLSLSDYESDVPTLLEQLWNLINTSFANLLTIEKTKELSTRLGIINNQLESQTEELQQQSEELLQKSDILSQQNVELEEQKQQISQANNLKSEFLSNMSHELRTPLNSINALSYVLLQQGEESFNEEDIGYLEIINRNGNRLLTLINDILDLSKIEAGKMDLNNSRFNLMSLINNTVESVRNLGEEKGLFFKVNSEYENIDIFSDESRLNQIFTNLIGNAIKFTQHGGVEVHVTMDRKKAYVDIIDTGIGIPKNKLDSIFEEFRQIDGSTSRNFEGTGLGLAIVQKLLKQLQGEISVESEVGNGSKFTVVLPLLPHAGRKKEYKGSKTEVPTGRKKILVVDDDINVISNIKGFLSKKGYEVIPALNGKEALVLAERYKPMAITLDILMPDMDGFEVLQNLKENHITKDIPVIMISVSEEKNTAVALGAVKHLIKPVKENSLMTEIQALDKEVNNVILIDDNLTEAKIMAKYFSNKGYEIDIAGSGDEGLQKLRKEAKDLILLDLMMPGMNGFEVLHELKNDANLAHIPVIIITAKDLTREERYLLYSNAASILQKNKGTFDELCDNIFYQIQNIENFKEKKLSSKSIKGIRSNKKTVLIVEDNPDNLVTMKAIIGNLYHVYEAYDGLAGFDKALNIKPDIILLDMALPKIDGEEFAKRLRKNAILKNIPVVAVTAQAMKGDEERFISAGCDAYVSKPINPEELLNKIFLLTK